MAKEMKAFPTHIKSVEGRVVNQIFSTFGVIDVYRDRIKNGAFKKTLEERMERIKVLWQHDNWLPPIAVLRDAFEVDRKDLPTDIQEKYPEATGGLEGEVEYLQTDRGEEVLQGISAGAITENSIGFDALQTNFIDVSLTDEVKVKIRELTEIRLWDLSPVNWGANPATGMRSAIPFKETGTTEKGVWVHPMTLGAFGDNHLENAKAHFAWASNDEFLLPHHVPASTGIGPVHINGLQDAMASLLGATIIPEEEKEAVYTHLSQHFAEFGEKAPPYALVELAYNVRNALTLSESDLKTCYEQLLALEAVLKAEPNVSKETITHFGFEKMRVEALQHYVDSV